MRNLIIPCRPQYSQRVRVGVYSSVTPRVTETWGLKSVSGGSSAWAHGLHDHLVGTHIGKSIVSNYRAQGPVVSLCGPMRVQFIPHPVNHLETTLEDG